MSTSSANASPEDVALEVRNAWQRLFNAGQFDQLVNMYARDVMFFGSAPDLMRGHDGVNSYFAHLPAGAKAQMGEHRAVQIAPGVVGDAGYVDFSVNGKLLPFRLSLVLVEDNGRWLIAQHHGSPRATPPG